MTATLTFTPVQDKLAEHVFDGRYRIIGFGGAIRGTKTWGCLAVLISLCRIYPGSRWAVVRTDLPTLRRNTIPSFNKLRETCDGFVGEINQSNWTATCTNGSQIVFFPESLDVDPDLNRWKGLEVNGFLLEEADELAEKSFHKAIERAGAWFLPNGEQPAPYILCTFNPSAAWPKRVFYEPWRNGTLGAPYAFIPATIADNPFAPDSYLEALKELPEQEYRRFVAGDWEVLSGRYYDNLDPRVHLIPRSSLPDPLPHWWSYWGAFDWGYAHWAVFGAFAQDTDGTVYLLDSVWQRRAQDQDYAETIRATMPEPCLRLVYAGHDCWNAVTSRGASGVTTAEEFTKAKIFLRRADIDRVNGGRAVRRSLDFKRAEDGRLVKAPTVRFIDTPGNRRVFDQLAEMMPDENNVNKPAKVDADSEGRGGDDGADMFRYGLSSHLLTPEAPGPQWVDKDRHPGWEIANGKATRKHVPHAVDAFEHETGRRTPSYRVPR